MNGVKPRDSNCAAQRLQDSSRKNHHEDGQHTTGHGRTKKDLPGTGRPEDAAQGRSQLHIAGTHRVKQVKEQKDAAEQERTLASQEQAVPAMYRSLQREPAYHRGIGEAVRNLPAAHIGDPRDHRDCYCAYRNELGQVHYCHTSLPFTPAEIHRDASTDANQEGELLSRIPAPECFPEVKNRRRAAGLVAARRH